MTNVTFSLPEGTIRRLRKRADESGGKKGAISEMVDEALTYYLDNAEASSRGETFTATKGGVVVAQAGSLRELAALLKANQVDFRSVVILSGSPLEPVGHLGLRVRPA
ncbi:MAG: hypothetical protein JRN06_03340 [Nitrososphaerota archaeon]|nr:hypothetical protein [Nitrososphaerota archaeon]MDG7023107.1 hypothetical protein [Nitrososphaerota archaeon]